MRDRYFWSRYSGVDNLRSDGPRTKGKRMRQRHAPTDQSWVEALTVHKYGKNGCPSMVPVVATIKNGELGHTEYLYKYRYLYRYNRTPYHIPFG